jgi:LacI family transcriptional regulator
VREVVNRAIAELGYRPNIAARSLASAKSFVVGALSPRADSAYFRWYHAELLSACRERGYHLVIEQIATDGSHMDQIRRFVSDMQFDGLVLSVGMGDSPDIQTLLKERSIRSVAISPRSTEIADLAVAADEAQGERELAELFWLGGHRRFAVAKPPSIWGMKRGQAFIQRLLDLGASRDDVVHYPYDWQIPGLEGGRRMAIDILSSEDRPTALYALSDELAAGAIGLCLTHGVDVPGTISIAGFDDIEIAKAVWPPLTTIQVPLATMVNRALNILVGSERTMQTAHILCPVKLVSRESVGPAPKHSRQELGA